MLSLCLNPLRLRLSMRLLLRCGGFLLAAAVCTAGLCMAQAKPSAPAPDVLVLSNGDILHGKLVSVIDGAVTFHTDSLGDVSLGWDKIKELHSSTIFAVLDKNTKLHGRHGNSAIPTGAIAVENQQVRVQVEGGVAQPPIPAQDARFILDVPTFEKDVHRQPSILAGWNGSATAGATLVAATENQYTFSGGIALARAIPTVTWLSPRNNTSIAFTGSYGKITQPGYYDSTGVYYPSITTKSAIYHAAAERDEYFSARFYALAQTAFDHNYSQDLDLQQIYGAGIGWTAVKTSRQQADFKATAQYEKQAFISGSSNGNQNLFGSTFSVNYTLNTRLVAYTQGLAFIPAYNNTRAYSTNETNTFAFPAYKNLGFSLGTLDSYLNNPPEALPPTKRNSFQFTMGLTYAIKSKY